METLNPDCDECKTPMLPSMWMIDGKVKCCDTPEAAFGKISFKCRTCAREKLVPHPHERTEFHKPEGSH